MNKWQNLLCFKLPELSQFLVAVIKLNKHFLKPHSVQGPEPGAIGYRELVCLSTGEISLVLPSLHTTVMVIVVSVWRPPSRPTASRDICAESSKFRIPTPPLSSGEVLQQSGNTLQKPQAPELQTCQSSETCHTDVFSAYSLWSGEVVSEYLLLVC